MTWYSKLLALALFVALPFIGFYFGAKYEEAKEKVGQTSAPSVNVPSSNVSGNNVTAGPTLSNVEGWKTYRNEKYGFEVKYPNLEFRGYTLGFKERRVDNVPHLGLSYWGFPSEGMPLVDIGILKGVTAADRIAYFQNKFSKDRDFRNVTFSAIRDTSIAGLPARQFFVIHPDQFEFGSDRLLITLVENGGIVYEFQLGTEEGDEYQDTYNQILSTFKFIP